MARLAARTAALAGCVFAVTVCGESSKFPTSAKSSGATPPSGNWVTPPLDTTVVAGDTFLVSFRATDAAGVASVTFSGFTVSGDSALGTFATTPVYSAISASFASPGPKDTTITRVFRPLTNNLTDSVFLGATVTNINKASKLIVRRIQVVGDNVPPGDTIKLPAKAPLLTVAAGDSLFVRTHVLDNRGVVSLTLTGAAKRGNPLLGTDTVVARYVTRTVALPQSKDTVITRYLRPVQPVDSTSEYVYVVATAKDSAGNTKVDTTQIRIVTGPKVTMLSPSDSSVTSPNKIITVSVHAKGTLGVHVLGWRATGAVNKNDSVIASPVGGALADTLTFTSNLSIPAGTPVGAISITGFALDTLNNPSAAVTPRTVLVQAVAAAVAPTVTFSVAPRVEVGDSITVIATGASGVGRVGFAVHHLGLNDTVQLARFSDTLPGNNTNVIAKFRLNLDTLAIGAAARVVTVGAFAWDSTGTKYAVAPFLDTLTVVAGTTVGLPQGGTIGDAIVDSNATTGLGRLLLMTNSALNQLERFQLDSNKFAAPVPVGANPVGIALWPKDTLGHYADTVLVANSGGTNLSIVDVTKAKSAEVGRRRLPVWALQTVTTKSNAGGGTNIIITEYNLANRPQYVGAACRKGAAATGCDSVLAVYSTAPTTAQSSPFSGRGYVAWENLMAAPTQKNSGHFFYEPSLGTATTENDSLQIIAIKDTAPGIQIRDTIVGAGAGLIVDIAQIPFQDSTFVRNAGNFLQSLIGEGGTNQGFARVMTYNSGRGMSTRTGTTCAVAGVPLMCTAQVDSGVSPGIYVRNFVVDRASPVRSIATNFNGRTNLVRADSVYVFDFTLRQTGLMQSTGGFPGMDMDPKNNYDADVQNSGTSKNDRLVFAARSDAGIDVFDTYWYQRIGTVPIRDTIIGPMRVANSSGTLVLAGVTSRGVVVIKLPNFVNPLPVSPPRPPASVTNGAPVYKASGTKAVVRK